MMNVVSITMSAKVVRMMLMLLLAGYVCAPVCLTGVACMLTQRYPGAIVCDCVLRQWMHIMRIAASMYVSCKAAVLYDCIAERSIVCCKVDTDSMCCSVYISLVT